MTLALMLGVQRSVEALTLSPRTSPSNYSTLTAGSTITVSSIRGSLNDADAEEEVSIAVVGGGTVVFDPATGPWTEETTTRVTSLTDGSGNGTITIPSSVKITIPDAGTVTVTVTWDNKDGSEDTKAFTFYVVTPPHLVSGAATAFSTADPAGVHYAYKGVEQQINTDFAFTTGDDLPVFYSVQGSGSLYVGASDPRLRLSNGTLTSSSAPVYLRGHTATSRITAFVAGTSPKTAVYIYNDPSNPARYPRLEITKGDDQTGAASGRLEDYLEVKVIDSSNRPVPGVAVAFTSVESDSMFIKVPGTMLTATSTSPAATISVITDSSGLARTYFQLGDASDTVTATLTGPGLTKTFTITVGDAESTRVANLEVVSGNPQSAEKAKNLADPLVVIARGLGGHRIPGVIIQFRTVTGTLYRASGEVAPTNAEIGLADASTLNPNSGQQIYVKTGSDGESAVIYNVGQTVVARDVIAEVRGEVGARQYDFAVDRVVFKINGGNTGGSGGGGGGDPDPPAITTRGSLSISVSGTGNTRSVTVTAQNAAGTAQPGISVVLNVNNGASLSRTSGPTPLSSTLTLPATAGDYLLTATTTADYTGDSETITITLPGNLGLALIGDQVNGAQTVQVTARTAAGSLETTAVLVTLTGAGISRTVTVTGSQNVPISLPATSGTLTASATGYNSGSVILPARTTGSRQQQQQQQQQQPITTSGEATSIVIEGSRRPTGTLAEEMRLRVQVLDANDNGVRDVAVTFRALSPGRGTFAGARGSGNAIRLSTDRSGYATGRFTPTHASSTGTVTVEAKAAGVSAAVTFIIDIEGDAGSATTGDTTAPREYNVGDKIPISLQDTLSFTGSRTLSGTTYVCVGSGTCVVSYGLVTRGEIQVRTAPSTSGTGDTPARQRLIPSYKSTPRTVRRCCG